MGPHGIAKTLPLAKIAGLIGRLPRFGRAGPLRPRLAGLDEGTRFQYALAVSVAIHAFVMFGVAFKPADLSKLADVAPPLEVVLVNAKTQTRPVKADARAQANLDGGGNTDADRRAKSPLPVMKQDHQVSDVSMSARRVEQLEQEAQRLLTQMKSQSAVPAPRDAEPRPEVKPTPGAADILSRSLEIARLEAQISRDLDAYQKRPRRKFVGARVEEYRLAAYIEDWRLKVERVGTLNYPSAARDQKLYGSLMLSVSIRADGSVEKTEINRSSGQKVLDEAALRIVRLAAPFAAFSAEIARDTDILVITRTWTFTRSDQLVAE